jgi:hypothetical protein
MNTCVDKQIIREDKMAKRTYDDKLKNILDWVEITNYHWHQLKGEMFNDEQFWDDTLHAMINDDWWDWVDIAPALKIQYETEWRRYPKLDVSTEAVHKDLMLGKAVTKKSRKGKNFQAFRLLMNIKDFVNDITGQPTHQYTAKDREPQPEPTPKELLFSFE